MTTHDSLIKVLRRRKRALQLSDALTDELAGLGAGHTGKLLGPMQVKSLGKIGLSALLGALALRLVVVEDIEQAELMRRRWTPRAERHVTMEGRRRKRRRDVGTRDAHVCYPPCAARKPRRDARHCDEIHRQTVIQAELAVPVEVDVYRAEQSTKH
jgi:hypothetical protein